MIEKNNSADLWKIFNLLVKNGGVVAIFLVAMATATLILFLDVFFELTEGKVWSIYFLVLLSTVSVHYICFFREI